MRAIFGVAVLGLLAGCQAGPQNESPIGMKPGYYRGTPTGRVGRQIDNGATRKLDMCVGDDPMAIPQLVVQHGLVNAVGCQVTRMERRGNLVTATCTSRDPAAEVSYEGVVGEAQVVGTMHIKLAASAVAAGSEADPQKRATAATLAQVGSMIPIGLTFTRSGDCSGGTTTRNPWLK